MESGPMLPFTERRISRRTFVGSAAAALTALSVPAAESKVARYKIIGFIKPFQNLEFARIADIAGRLDWDGVEIPVRKGGTIEPEQVEEKLPELSERLKQTDVEISIIATDIAEADPLA